MAMQLMVIGAKSIEEQLAHMSEAVTKLTKLNQRQEVHKKGPHHEAESVRKDWVMKQSRVRSCTEKVTPPRWVLYRSNNYKA
ncbi:unnamed protein product [Prunus armeniaca]